MFANNLIDTINFLLYNLRGIGNSDVGVWKPFIKASGNGRKTYPADINGRWAANIQ